jgi:aspartate/methionine/tyrosine aminotransferase/L-lysine 2,3-aminomutase
MSMLELVLAAPAGRYRAYGPKQLDSILRRYPVPAEVGDAIRWFCHVLPFRVNDYVLDELIDWQRIPDDPIFQLVFPQPGMLNGDDERQLIVAEQDGPQALAATVSGIRSRLNPHPSGQAELNVPTLNGEPLAGVQHKYRETVLYFPSAGQTCHAYCTYCFRWAQFVGADQHRFSAADPDRLVSYLHRHPAVSDVLVTGGDPMIMSGSRLRRHLEPLLAVESVRTIRIGTKSLSYWPQRFTSDPDADEVLRLFRRVVGSGRTLAVMAHLSHPRELEPEIARSALQRIRNSGAVVYCQAPLMARVNDDPAVWGQLWRSELALGAVPYYMFVARDTGPRDYFKVPLSRAVQIFGSAYRTLPGLARTVRGPVMSTVPGKVVVDGIERDPAGSYFQLRLLQARDPNLVGRPFRARYSATASWLDELELMDTTQPDLLAAFRTPVSRGSTGRERIRMSANLAIDQLINQRRATGDPVLHLGFGEARLPIPAEFTAPLRAAGQRRHYGPVAGDLAVRTAAAGYFTRRRLATEPDQVVLAPGSKPLLMAVVAAVPGDVLLPKPCWLSYASQARLLDRRTHLVPVPDECGGVPEPAALLQAIRQAQATGGAPSILVLTLPDNPTGTLAPPSLIRAVCDIAERENLLVISDEIYRDMLHEPSLDVLSPAELIPHRTVVTSGLSKNLSLGGWRIGFARFAAGPAGQRLRQDVTAIASEVWSTLAGPMQAVAGYLLDEPDPVRQHLAASTRLHAAVARAVHQVMVEAGALCRPPTGGFYVYPDFEPRRDRLAAAGVGDSAQLARFLLDRGIAVLAGAQLGDDRTALRFRAATGLLYGDTDELRWAALRSADPVRLPHIDQALAAVRAAVAGMVG